MATNCKLLLANGERRAQIIPFPIVVIAHVSVETTLSLFFSNTVPLLSWTDGLLNRWLERLPKMQIYILICSGKTLQSTGYHQFPLLSGKVELEEHHQERYKKLFFKSICSFKLIKKRQWNGSL